ncbi:hypothetical protein BG005_006216, partial [Podila minutissima]
WEQHPQGTIHESWLWKALSFVGLKRTTQEDHRDSNVETSTGKIRFSSYPGHRPGILKP